MEIFDITRKSQYGDFRHQISLRIEIRLVGFMSARIAENIKSTVLELITDLKDSIFTGSDEQGDLLMVEFFFKKMNNTSISDHIVARVLPHKVKIEKRNIEFFITEKKHIFAGLPEDRIEYFSNLVTRTKEEGGLADDDREAIWNYFDTLVILAEEYKKKK
jgi:hypothetical protein